MALNKYMDTVAWECKKYVFLHRLRHISSTGRERFTWHLKKPFQTQQAAKEASGTLS